MSQKAPSVATIPFLEAQWDYEHNTEDIHSVSSVSQTPVHWRCKKCGYSWSAQPKSRYKAAGSCPCCDSGKVIRRGVNDVFTVVPDLMESYDFEKNGDFDIYSEGINSLKKVFWKCPICGRSWKTAIRARIRLVDGQHAIVPCPHYNTVKRKAHEVPVVSNVPNLIKFWNYAENQLDPSVTRSNSPDRAAWICDRCGYKWETTIVVQAQATGKCACCDLHIVKEAGVSDVFTLLPDLKKSYDFLKNGNVDIEKLGIRNKEVLLWWRCPDCGFEWQAPIASRIKGTRGNYSIYGCRQCYYKDTSRLTPVSSIPSLLKFWDFTKNVDIDPNLTSAYSSKLAHWRCKECGYTWSSTIHTRKDSNGACPCCESGVRIVSGRNDVVTLVPDILSIFDVEANPDIDLSSCGTTSKKLASWKCKKCNYVWSGTIGKRVKKTSDGSYRLVDCPNCSSLAKRKQTYAEQYPELLPLFDEEKNGRSLASVVSSESNSIKFWWLCPACGNPFQSRLQSMIGAQKTSTKGCPYCSRMKLLPGESFAEVHEDLMAEYDPANTIDPFAVFPNHRESVSWICSHNPDHKWEASFALRHAGYGRCPICNRTQLVEDVNSFAAVYPELVELWSPSNERAANKVFYNATPWFKWVCPTCSGEYGAFIKDVVEADNPCPYCNDRQVLPGFNSFMVQHKDLMDEWDSLSNYLLADPNQIGDSCTIPVWWNCPHSKEHHYIMSPKQRLLFQKRQQEPCLYCKGKRRKKHHFV